MKRFALVFSLVLLFTLALVGLASAQSSEPRPVSDDEVNAIAKQLYCPVCENIPLDVCGTQACEQWRELIRLKLSQGETEEQIKQYFVDQYGERVRGTRHWWVYAIPPAVIILGAYVLYRAFQAWKRPAPAATAGASADAGPPESDEYMRRLEEELRKR